MKLITKYNIFNFFTVFAKSLVEVFIPIILYTRGVEIKSIILFFMFCFAINILMSYIVTRIGEKIGFRWIILVSGLLFSGMYYYLQTNNNLLILAILYSATNMAYYVGKHNYASSVISEKSVSVGVGSFLIVMIIATIPASFVGALLIEKISLFNICLIVFLIYLVGSIPLFKIKYKNHHHDSIKKMIKKIPFSNYIYFALTQFKALFSLLYPLYVFIYIKNNFQYIGILNAIIGVASIIFIHFYAKKMDKDKKDHMLFAAIFLSLILLFEISIKNSILLLVVSVVDGIATKLYETSSARDFYLFDKDYDKSCYFMVSEFLNNGVKLILLFLVFIFNFSLYWILIIFIIGIFASGFVKYKEPTIT